MAVIVFCNQKGGVGKTTSVISLAAVAADLCTERDGKRVVVIDMDHSVNLTDYFLEDVSIEKIEKRNVFQIFSGEKSAEECVYKTANSRIDCIPATPDLVKAGFEFSNKPMAIMRFVKEIRSLPYAHVFIDTPGALLYEVTAALMAADIVVIPFNLNRWAMRGIKAIEGAAKEAIDQTNRATKIWTLPCMNTPAKQEGIESLKLKNRTITIIPKNAKIEDSINDGVSNPLQPKTAAYKAFLALAKELNL